MIHPLNEQELLLELSPLSILPLPVPSPVFPRPPSKDSLLLSPPFFHCIAVSVCECECAFKGRGRSSLSALTAKENKRTPQPPFLKAIHIHKHTLVTFEYSLLVYRDSPPRSCVHFCGLLSIAHCPSNTERPGKARPFIPSGPLQRKRTESSVL